MFFFCVTKREVFVTMSIRTSKRKDICSVCKCRKFKYAGVQGLNLCVKCINKITRDACFLLQQPKSISHKTFSKWLDKYGNTNSLMFINGRFNKKPERLFTTEKILNSLHLKNFRDSFKYDDE